MVRRRRSLQFESLESLVLLSAAPGPQPAAVQAAPKPTSSPTHPDLSGTIRGLYTIRKAGSHATFQLKGAGHNPALGPFRLSGTFDGKTAPSENVMDVTLSSRAGGVTLRIVKAQEVKPQATDAHTVTVPLRYTIIGGTGAYRGARGVGVVDLAVVPGAAARGLMGRVSLDLKPDVLRE